MDSKLQIGVLLLALACTVFSTTCPPPEDIYPCSCSVEYNDMSLRCINADISLVELKRIINAFDKKIGIVVKLERMKLGTIPSDFFDGFNIKVLDIVDSKLDSLAEEGGLALAGLVHTLRDLSIESSFLQGKLQTKLDLSHLQHLTNLEFLRNEIPELGNDWFVNAPPQLRRLYFVDNGIQKLGDRAFANLSKLGIFQMDGNRFGQLKRSMLPNPATQLSIISLDANALTSLPEDFFIGMPTMRFVHLKGNKLTQILEGTFQPVWDDLIKIDLRENPLDCGDSSIRWMVNANTKVQILGTCHSPSDRKGMELKYAIQSLKGI